MAAQGWSCELTEPCPAYLGTKSSKRVQVSLVLRGVPAHGVSVIDSLALDNTTTARGHNKDYIQLTELQLYMHFSYANIHYAKKIYTVGSQLTKLQ